LDRGFRPGDRPEPKKQQAISIYEKLGFRIVGPAKKPMGHRPTDGGMGRVLRRGPQEGDSVAVGW